MTQIMNIVLIIVMFLTSFYMLDMIYQLKLKLAISEINISSLENKLKLIELKTSLLQNKEVLSVNTVSDKIRY